MVAYLAHIPLYGFRSFADEGCFARNAVNPANFDVGKGCNPSYFNSTLRWNHLDARFLIFVDVCNMQVRGYGGIDLG
jgi:hypothetical protein